MRTTGESLWTVAHIASYLGVPRHRVERILDTRPHIRAIARAGIARVFDQRAVDQIAHESQLIDLKQSKGVKHG